MDEIFYFSQNFRCARNSATHRLEVRHRRRRSWRVFPRAARRRRCSPVSPELCGRAGAERRGEGRPYLTRESGPDQLTPLTSSLLRSQLIAALTLNSWSSAVTALLTPFLFFFFFFLLKSDFEINTVRQLVSLFVDCQARNKFMEIMIPRFTIQYYTL